MNKRKIRDNLRLMGALLFSWGRTGIPTIGDNVSLGANVLIIGGVHVGNNVPNGLVVWL